jgi:hypothetical protein
MNEHRHEGRARTNLWCHACEHDFSVDLDYDLDGNHVIHCPHCGHEHYRLIQGGVVTDIRWRSSAGPTWTYSTSATTTTPSMGNVYLSPTAPMATTTTGAYVALVGVSGTGTALLNSLWARGTTTGIY